MPGGGDKTEGQPFGDEALAFVKEMTLQREVEIEVESIDKGGNFIGWMHLDNTNLSVALVEEGFASSFVTSDEKNYGRLIQIAEDNAKARKERRWANFVEEEHTEKEDEEKETVSERKVNYEKVVVTEVTDEAKVFVQNVDEGPKLVELMKEIRSEFSANPPLAGAYVPKRGDLCAAKFVDDEWYRAKVEKVSANDAQVLYVDYGNRATIPKGKCGTLPSSFTKSPPFAKEYNLALCALPTDEDYLVQSLAALRQDMLDRTLNMNTEYRVQGTPFVSLFDPEEKTDLVKTLIQDGLLLVEKKGGRKMEKMIKDYLSAMESAKKEHLNIWEYGDITADDAKEFGVMKKT